MTAVFVRVVMGISYDNNTSLSLRLAISTNSEHQVQLAPIESKLNSNQIIKVRRSGSPASE